MSVYLVIYVHTFVAINQFCNKLR